MKKKVFPTESGRLLWAANSTPAVRLDYFSACIIINIFVGQAIFICSHKSQWTLDLEISWESGVSLTRYADSVLINGSTWYLTNQHSNQGTGKFRKGLECRVGEEREREKGGQWRRSSGSRLRSPEFWEFGLVVGMSTILFLYCFLLDAHDLMQKDITNLRS